jgi:phenylpyruvate tautomerase
MPLIEISLSQKMSDQKMTDVARALSRILAEGLNKPEKYVMATLHVKDIVMAGTDEPAAYIDIKSIGGLTPVVSRTLSKAICEYVSANTDISPERVYITMSDVPAECWGWNGSTFG